MKSKSSGWRLLKIGWCLICTYGAVTPLLDGGWRKSLSTMAGISGTMVLQNILLFVVLINVYKFLAKAHPFFRWSLFSLFQSREDRAEGREAKAVNVNLIPMYVKYFGLFFAILFAATLPYIAMVEERWFRDGTHGWVDGVCRSLAFGVMHCLVGVPIGAGLAITIAGLWFTHLYFVGGIKLSAMHHTTYDLIIVSMVFLVLVLQHVAGVLKTREKAAVVVT